MKATFIGTLVNVQSLTSVAGNGIITFDVFLDGVDALSTDSTIDANEDDSNDAAIPSVINTANDDVQIGDDIRIDVVSDAGGTSHQGATVILFFDVDAYDSF